MTDTNLQRGTTYAGCCLCGAALPYTNEQLLGAGGDLSTEGRICPPCVERREAGERGASNRLTDKWSLLREKLSRVTEAGVSFPVEHYWAKRCGLTYGVLGELLIERDAAEQQVDALRARVAELEGERDARLETPTDYLSQIMRIIAHGREGNADLVSAYAELLADRLEADGHERQAAIIRRWAKGDYGQKLYAR